MGLGTGRGVGHSIMTMIALISLHNRMKEIHERTGRGALHVPAAVCHCRLLADVFNSSALPCHPILVSKPIVALEG